MSAMLKATPGPWQLLPPSQGLDHNWHVTDKDDTFVAHVFGFGHAVDEQSRINARLIAAAPDLLEVLRITAGNIRSLGPAGALAAVHEPYSQWLAAVEAVIAKATGEQQ